MLNAIKSNATKFPASIVGRTPQSIGKNGGRFFSALMKRGIQKSKLANESFRISNAVQQRSMFTHIFAGSIGVLGGIGHASHGSPILGMVCGVWGLGLIGYGLNEIDKHLLKQPFSGNS